MSLHGTAQVRVSFDLTVDLPVEGNHRLDAVRSELRNKAAVKARTLETLAINNGLIVSFRGTGADMTVHIVEKPDVTP